MKRILPFIGLILWFSIFGCNQSNRPLVPFENVVVIIGDDHAIHALGAYGNPLVKTPNLDRMAANGTLFTHAYANSPMCTASRQSILTGKYPHASGVTLLRTALADSQLTIAEHLKANGFQTAAIGKMHFNTGLSHGFENLIGRKDFFSFIEENQVSKVSDSIAVRPPWKPFQDHARIWLNADARPGSYYDKDDIGTWYSQKAIEFIEQNQDQRFCLWLGFHEPHSPFNFPVEYQGNTTANQISLPAGSEEDDRWIPAVFSDLTEEEKRGITAAYYNSVEYLDKNVGMVIDHLEKRNLLEKTLIIYLGDHGYLLNHHKRFEKHTMWEEAVKAPLIIQANGQFGKNQIIDNLVEFVDLAPTILEALGIDPMNGLQGKSLLPLLNGEPKRHKNYIFSEFLADNKAMIRTEKWKYIYTSGQHDLAQGYATGKPPSGVLHKLYDMINDPNETTNVSHLPELADTLKALQKTLLSHFQATHPNTESINSDISLEIQLKGFCNPPEGQDINAK